MLDKAKAEIGDMYPFILPPSVKGRRTEVNGSLLNEPDDVPPGHLVPVAYFWTRTVTCKNPACKATVPLVKQTWMCKKKGSFVALKPTAPKGEKKVRFEVVGRPPREGWGLTRKRDRKGERDLSVLRHGRRQRLCQSGRACRPPGDPADGRCHGGSPSDG